jgi:hypothetical protein
MLIYQSHGALCIVTVLTHCPYNTTRVFFMLKPYIVFIFPKRFYMFLYLFL